MGYKTMPEKAGHTTAPVKRKLPTPPTEIPDEAPKSKGIKIVIRPIHVVRTTIEIVGVTPLIMHAWSQKAIDMIAAKQGGQKTNKRQAKVPEDEFNLARYRIDEDTDGIPATALKSCAVEAGVALGVFKTHLRKAFFVAPDGGELVPIICPGGPVLRRDMVRVGMGTADVRYRPEYRNWRCKFEVEYQPDLISADDLFNLYENAGYSIGLGEWRAEKNGNRYGKFRIAVKDE